VDARPRCIRGHSMRRSGRACFVGRTVQDYLRGILSRFGACEMRSPQMHAARAPDTSFAHCPNDNSGFGNPSRVEDTSQGAFTYFRGGKTCHVRHSAPERAERNS